MILIIISPLITYTSYELVVFKDEIMVTKKNKRTKPIFIRDTEGIVSKKLAEYLLSLRKTGEVDQTPVLTKTKAVAWAKTHTTFPQRHLDRYELGLVEEQLRGHFDIRYSSTKLVEVAEYVYKVRSVYGMNLRQCRDFLSSHFVASRPAVQDALNAAIMNSFQLSRDLPFWDQAQYGKFEYLCKNLADEQKIDTRLGWERHVFTQVQNYIFQCLHMASPRNDARYKIAPDELKRFRPIIENELRALVDRSRDAGQEQLVELTKRIIEISSFRSIDFSGFDLAVAFMSQFDLPNFELYANLRLFISQPESLKAVQKFTEFVKDLSPEELVESFRQIAPIHRHGSSAVVLANLIKSNALTPEQSIAFAEFAVQEWAGFPKYNHEKADRLFNFGMSGELDAFKDSNSQAYEAFMLFSVLRKQPTEDWDKIPRSTGPNPAFDVLVNSFPEYVEKLIDANFVPEQEEISTVAKAFGLDSDDPAVTNVLQQLVTHPNASDVLASLQVRRADREAKSSAIRASILQEGVTSSIQASSIEALPITR